MKLNTTKSLISVSCVGAFCLSSWAQEEITYPHNHDSDSDGIITVVDLMSILSEYGELATLNTCFKGDLCVYFSSGYNNSINSDPNCGTIIGRSDSSNQLYISTINVISSGYSTGDVIHVYHQHTGQPTEQLILRTLIAGNWQPFAYLNLWNNTLSIQFDGFRWVLLN
jgi:hypothetical protein